MLSEPLSSSEFAVFGSNATQMSSQADLRERTTAKADPAKATSKDVPIQRSSEKSGAAGVGVTDVLRIIGGLFLLNCLLSYFITNDSVLWGYRPWFVRPGVVARYFVSTIWPCNLTSFTELIYAYSKVPSL